MLNQAIMIAKKKKIMYWIEDLKYKYYIMEKWQIQLWEFGACENQAPKKIEKDNDKTEDCKMEMLVAWLQQQDEVSKKGVPSWSVLWVALKMIGENELADKVSFDGQLWITTLLWCCVMWSSIPSHRRKSDHQRVTW